MSNEDGVKIQTTAPDEQPGGQRPLESDSKKSTHGFDSTNQNTLSFCRGTNVEAASAPVSSRNGLSDGVGVTGRQQENAKSVGANHIEGSNKGDHRTPDKDTAAASLAKAASNGGPRNPVGQFPNSGRTPAAPAPQSFTGNSDAGN